MYININYILAWVLLGVVFNGVLQLITCGFVVYIDMIDINCMIKLGSIWPKE